MKNQWLPTPEIKESIPFTTATKRIKYLGINLPKETKELYTENYKTLMKERHKQMEKYSMFLVSQSVSSVAQSCPTLCNPINRSTPGLPVHHQLPEFTQTHVHRVRDAIQPSHPRSSPSPSAPNPSQHQSLFQ